MPIRSFTRIAVVMTSCGIIAGCSHAGTSTETAATPAAAAASKAPALPAGVTLAMVAAGDSIYHAASCQRCHGPDAKGTNRAPDLTDNMWSQISGTYDEIVKLVTTGVPKAQVKMPGAPFGMNPKGGTNLTDDQIRQVSAYVYTLSHK
jgi:mono/diheme cytochrome c family protein